MSGTIDENKEYTEAEAAELLGISAAALRKRRARRVAGASHVGPACQQDYKGAPVRYLGSVLAEFDRSRRIHR